MEKISYLDFDLKIERASQGYRVSVVDSPAGQASSEFALPFSDLELENFVLRMSRTRRGTRRLGTPELEAARTFGGRLFESLFGGEVRGCLRSSLDAAAREGKGLRLRLRLTDVPELVDLPWEYLYSSALNRFFVLSNATPLVRYLDLPERVAPLSVQPPLRLLATIASPRDFPALDVEQEWEKLRGALRELEESGLVSLERLEPPTLNALQRRLRGSPCHILHFIGHGAFDEAAQDGVLLLEDLDARGHIVSAQDLGVLLHDHNSMRLVVLNSCEGARTSRTDPFAGAAQSLVQQGIPAVVAMQFEISDDAAIAISHEFYAALAAGYPVDAALAEARKAVFTSGSGAEWGTPVLYLRTPDGRIFSLEPARQPVKSESAPVEQPVVAPPVAVSTEPPVVPVARPVSTDAPTPIRRLVPGPKIRWGLVALIAVLALAFGLSGLVPDLWKGRGQVEVATDRAPGAGAPATSLGPAGVTPVAAATLLADTRLAETTPGATTAAGATPAGQLAQAVKSIDQLVAENPRVLSTTAWVHDLIPEKDGVWAATSGGLVRWKADGTNEVFTSADGLPFSHTRALLAMPDGSIWAGGNYGVVHISPTDDTLGEIERYSRAEGIIIGQDPVFMLDADGSVWLASLYGDSPVVRFDGSLWRPPDLPLNDPALKDVDPQITAMMQGKDGSLWAGLYRDGILRWGGKSWTHFGPEQGLPKEEKIWRLLEDERGVIWAATGPGGLLRLDRGAGTWERVEFQRVGAPVFWISQLPDKSLWASGDDFIARSEDGGERWKLIATPADNLSYPTAVVQDGSGVIWVATGNGIAMHEGGRWRALRRPGEPSMYSMGQILPDPEEKLWVLPEYGGNPSVMDPATGLAISPPQKPPESTDIISLAFGGGAIWVGTSDGLVRVKDGALRRLRQGDGLPDNRVGVLLTATKTLWIGTAQGLATLDLDSGQVTGTVEALSGQVVDQLAMAPDGAIWAATQWGDQGANSAVHRIAGTDHVSWPNDATPLNGAGHWVESLAVAEDGAIWVGSDGGVYRWDGKKWMGWEEGQGAPTGDIYAMLPQNGAMWIAGHSGMIDRWNAEDGWLRIRPQGLTADVLDMQISSNGALWLATEDGLLRYGP